MPLFRELQFAVRHLIRTPGFTLDRRGYYAIRDTPHPHWKYFLFD